MKMDSHKLSSAGLPTSAPLPPAGSQHSLTPVARSRHSKPRDAQKNLRSHLAIRGERAFGLAVLASILSCSHENALDSSAGLFASWEGKCRIHRSCESVEPFPLCPNDQRVTPTPRPALANQGEATFSIAGQLRFAEALYTLMSCKQATPPFCCNKGAAVAELVTEDGSTFRLPGFGCFGDESRLCCNVDLKQREQWLVATGVMRTYPHYPQSSPSGVTWHWSFKEDVAVCRLESKPE